MGHNSGKKQSSMTLIKYDHLQVIETITGKFHQNPLNTVRRVAETRLCLWTEGGMEGRTDGRTQKYSPLQLTPGDQKKLLLTDGLDAGGL